MPDAMPSIRASLAALTGDAVLDAIPGANACVARYDTVAGHACLAGQSVASALYRLLGIGDGPTRDLDVFATARVEDVIPPQAHDHGANWSGRSRDKPWQRTRPVWVSFGDTVGFFPGEGRSRYRVNGTGRDGALNAISIALEDPIQDGRDFAANVIEDFDLGAVQVGIDLRSRTLVWTDAFLEFLASRQLRVSTTFTAAHTLLRLLQKQRDLPWAYCDFEFESLVLALALAQGDTTANLIGEPTRGKFSDLIDSGPGGESIADGRFIVTRAPPQPGDVDVPSEARRWVVRPSGAQREALVRRLLEAGVEGLFNREPHHGYGPCALRLGNPHAALPAWSRMLWGPTARGRQRIAPEALEHLQARAEALPNDHPTALRVRRLWSGLEDQGPGALAGLSDPASAIDRMLNAYRRFPDLAGKLSLLPLATQCQVASVVRGCVRRRGLWVVGYLELYRESLAGFERREALESVLDAYLERTGGGLLVAEPLPQRRVREVLIRELARLQDLLEEGSTMRHCVGGWAREVADGRARVLSLESAAGRTTAALAHSHISVAGQNLPHVVEHVGVRNRPPLASHARALQGYVGALRRTIILAALRARPRAAVMDLLRHFVLGRASMALRRMRMRVADARRSARRRLSRPQAAPEQGEWDFPF